MSFGWMLALYLEHISFIKQVSWLTDHHMVPPSHTLGLCNGMLDLLPDYSDQFAWDSHPNSLFMIAHALNKVIFNYTLIV